LFEVKIFYFFFFLPDLLPPEETGGQGSFSFIFSDTNLDNFAETFFSIHDKAMMWIALLTLSAFFMPRCSAIHAWDTVAFFQCNPASCLFGGSM
jgi:hypothetical protein